MSEATAEKASTTYIKQDGQVWAATAIDALRTTSEPFPGRPIVDMVEALGLTTSDCAAIRIDGRVIEVDIWTRDDTGAPVVTDGDVLLQTLRRRIDWPQS